MNGVHRKEKSPHKGRGHRKNLAKEKDHKDRDPRMEKDIDYMESHRIPIEQRPFESKQAGHDRPPEPQPLAISTWPVRLHQGIGKTIETLDPRVFENDEVVVVGKLIPGGVQKHTDGQSPGKDSRNPEGPEGGIPEFHGVGPPWFSEPDSC
jgi:hypothetical protein